MFKLLLMRIKLYRLCKKNENHNDIKELKKNILIEEMRYLYGQTTFVYCPKCGCELISSDSFVFDEELVTYKCVKCGVISEWDFDSPAPILIQHIEID